MFDKPADDDEGIATDRLTLATRSVRALTECMTTLPLEGGVYSVTTESGREYAVDALERRCTCPDATHNLADSDTVCKHVRRVEYAEGDREIPAWVDASAIDPLLGHHVDGGVVKAPGAADVGVEDDARPDDCECIDTNEVLACFACWMSGFETPNPTVEQ